MHSHIRNAANPIHLNRLELPIVVWLQMIIMEQINPIRTGIDENCVIQQ